jgi:hypothetical protein
MRHAIFRMERPIRAIGSALIAYHAAQKAKLVCRTDIASPQTLGSSIVGFVLMKHGLSLTVREPVMKVEFAR